MNLRYKIISQDYKKAIEINNNNIEYYTFRTFNLPYCFKKRTPFGLNFCWFTLFNKIENEPSGIGIKTKHF